MAAFFHFVNALATSVNGGTAVLNSCCEYECRYHIHNFLSTKATARGAFHAREHSPFFSQSLVETLKSFSISIVSASGSAVRCIPNRSRNKTFRRLESRAWLIRIMCRNTEQS